MGKRQKGNAPVMKTHKRFFSKIKGHDFLDLLIWENVTEYDLGVLKRHLKGWTVKSVNLDPQLFGLPASRARMYALAFPAHRFQWGVDVPSLEVTLAGLCSRRSTSFTCSQYWWNKLPRSSLSHFEAWEAEATLRHKNTTCNHFDF